MVESVKRWWTMVSTGFRLILAMLAASGLGMLATWFLRKRAQTARSLKDSSRSRFAEVVNEAGKVVAVQAERVAQATEQAAKHEAAADALDARVQAARDRVAALRKELGKP